MELLEERRGAGMIWDKMNREDRIGQDRTGQDRTGQDRTGQDRTGCSGWGSYILRSSSAIMSWHVEQNSF